MSVNSKLTAIADKTRSLVGLSGKMGLDAMSSNLGEAVNECDTQASLIHEIETALIGKAAGNGGGVELPTLQNQGNSEHLLEGKQLINQSGIRVIGRMPNKGAVDATIDGLTAKSYTVPEGYHNGSGTVSLTDDIDNIALEQGDLIQQIKTALAEKAAGGGVELPDIPKEELGTASDLAEGKKLIGADGRVVEGKVPVYEETDFIMEYAEIYVGEGYISPKAMVEDPVMFKGGVNLYVDVPAEAYGDAAPEDVRAGKTFTSKEGFCIRGSAVFPGEQYHCWEKYEDGSRIVETEKSGVVLSSQAVLSGDYFDAVQYADDVVIVDGGISLVDDQYLYIDGTDDISTILGKYVYSERNDAFYRIPSDATASSSGTQSSKISVSTAFLLSAEVSKGDFLEDVFSEEADTYPENGIQDGYWYVYQGLQEGSSGKDPVIQALTVTENGTYTAPNGVDGYSPVTVSVPIPDGYIKPSGTLNIKENGTHNVTNYDSVNVNVPSSGVTLPEGAVVVQKVLAAQASQQIGSGYSLSITYGDNVEINDSIALAFSGTTQNLSNISDTTDFSVLLGKYVRSGSTMGGSTGTFYYIPDDATFTVGGSNYSKTLTCNKAQKVSMQKVSV